MRAAPSSPPWMTLAALVIVGGCAGDKPANPGDDTDADGPPLYIDQDGDGYGYPEIRCEAPTGSFGCVEDATDCDDFDESVHPGAIERCNVADDDCDEVVDEGLETGTLYRDWDGDGFGDPSREAEGCLEASGWSRDQTDCDDYDASSWPGAEEVCDESDNDCDGEEDEGFDALLIYYDDDYDKYGDPETGRPGCEHESWIADGTDCLDSEYEVNPGRPEDCGNGYDDDCDGLLDCEDDGCSSDGRCGERLCADGLDDDEDGHLDCDDDECWGDLSCPGVVASHVLNVKEGEHTWRRRYRWRRDTCDSVTTSTYERYRLSSMEMSEIEGSVRVFAPGDGVPRTCAWGAARVSFRFEWHTTQSARSSTVSSFVSDGGRESFWITGSCGLTDSDFLPALSELPGLWQDRYGNGRDWQDSDHADNGCDKLCWGCDTGGYSDSDARYYGTDLGPGARHVITTATGSASAAVPGGPGR